MLTEIILNVLKEYVPAIIIIMGLIEFTRQATEKKRLSKYMILQLIFCLVAGVLSPLQGWGDGYTAGLIILMITKWLTFISLTTLFYELIVRKIKEAGGKIKGE